MGKLDLKRTMPTYAARRGASDLVSVPPLRYLMINGQGDPKTATAYADALAALYPVAYVLKFRSKTAGQDYVVPSLEALWWAAILMRFTKITQSTVQMLHLSDLNVGWKLMKTEREQWREPF